MQAHIFNKKNPSRSREVFYEPETRRIRTVLAQFNSRDLESPKQLEEHLEFIGNLMEKTVAIYGDVDLFITPECSLQGVHPEMWEQMLLDIESPFLYRLSQKCRELEVWGVFNPWLKSEHGRPYTNSVVIIDSEGFKVYRYDKMYPWIPSETVDPGNDIPICRGPGGIKIFCMLSSDGEYPSMWQHAATAGADIIIRLCHYMTPYHGAYSLTNQAMAVTTGCWVLACNATGIDEQYTYFGSSQVVNPKGVITCEASDRLPGLLKIDFYPAISERKHAFVPRNSEYTTSADGNVRFIPILEGGGM